MRPPFLETPRRPQKQRRCGRQAWQQKVTRDEREKEEEEEEATIEGRIRSSLNRLANPAVPSFRHDASCLETESFFPLAISFLQTEAVTELPTAHLDDVLGELEREVHHGLSSTLEGENDSKREEKKKKKRKKRDPE